MIDLTTIQNKVNTAHLYYQSLISDYATKLVKGCNDKPKHLDCLRAIIASLSADVRDEVNTEKTQLVYGLLIRILGGYSEVYVVDPSVKVPNTVIVVESSTGIPPITITDADFTGDQYLNPAMAGMTDFVVFDQNINRYLKSDEFNYIPTGGIEIVGGIYGGEQYILIF